jgi:threonine/homoserine/homoserine lactone efflux protein
MKTFAQLSVAGVAAVLLLKLLGVIVVPLLGFLAAAFAFTFKLLLIAGAAWLIWRLVRKSGCCGTRDEE